MSPIFYADSNIKKRLFQLEFYKTNATIELLKSSVLVSISGLFRIYLAALLLGTQVNMSSCFAGFLIIYSVYTMDRTMGSKEDDINRGELQGSSHVVGLTMVLITFTTGGLILAKEGLLVYAFLPFVTGYLYSKGLKIRNRSLRLKGGLGVKNIVVGLTWGIFISVLTGSTYKNFLPVFLLYGVKTFINSAIDDFKDVKGDTLAGIKTLPVRLGARNTRNFLLGLHLLSHLILGIALLKGVIAFEPLIIIGSVICGLICILKYTNEEKYLSGYLGLTVFKDGESTLIAGLLSIC